MKYIVLSFVALVLITSCEREKELTIAEKIAYAHGFEHWENVSEIQFTFKVDVDTIKGKGRSWKWKPKTGDITMVTSGRTFEYNQKTMSQNYVPVDRAFINDKFWVFIPFQLVWDSDATISEVSQSVAPISKTKMDMISITYPSDGGYTPGDAYDIYFDKEYVIKEWSYRKGNAVTANLSNTFENYQDFNGIKIAIDHKKDDGNWNLNFTNVSVQIDN